MTTDSPIIRDGNQCTAATDLSLYQYYMLHLVGPKQLGVMTDSVGQVFYGVLQNQPTAGQICDVGIVGVTKLVAGASIAYGQQLMPNGNGQAVPWVGDNLLVGVALESASVDELFSALVVSALSEDGGRFGAIYIVSTLPLASSALKGVRAFVSDATAPTFATTLSGLGSVFCPVYCDGTEWLAG